VRGTVPGRRRSAGRRHLRARRPQPRRPDGLPTGRRPSQHRTGKPDSAMPSAEISHAPVVDTPEQARCQQAIFGLGAASQRASDLHVLLLWSLAGLGVATVMAGVLGWATGRRILLPLHTLTAAARRTSQEHLGERISFDGADDELKELADTFDDMLARLDRAFASQRRFMANAAHELRTPLTSARTLVDVAMAKPVRTTRQLEVLAVRVREALGQSEALIEGLLTLARSDRGLTSYESADLEAAAQDAIDQVSATARHSRIVIDADLSPSPAPRRPDTARAPRRQPARQRRPLQRQRRLGKGRHGYRRWHVVHHRHQHRTPRARIGGGIPIRTIHAPRRTSLQPPGRRARPVHRRLGRQRPLRSPPGGSTPRGRNDNIRPAPETNGGHLRHDAGTARQ
jgi:signal transduction histidine kinase